jgi:hypothetical protein
MSRTRKLLGLGLHGGYPRVVLLKPIRRTRRTCYRRALSERSQPLALYFDVNFQPVYLYQRSGFAQKPECRRSEVRSANVVTLHCMSTRDFDCRPPISAIVGPIQAHASVAEPAVEAWPDANVP